MSKEATGQMGAKIGSREYWSKVNRGAALGSLMEERTNYRATLQQLGTRASGAIEEIYADLSALGSKIRYLPSSDRKALAKQVEGLYDVCKPGGATAHHASECVQGLNLSIMSPWTASFRDERGIEKAIAIIEKSRYAGSDAVKLLKEAARWGITSAAERDPKKREFLELVSQGSISSRFLQDVVDEYQARSSFQRYEGRCGHTVGGSSYRNHIEKQVFGYVLPGFGDADYEKTLRNALKSVAEQLERDLDNAKRENDYITDETAAKLNAVVNELDHCGVSTGSLNRKIEGLAWFVGGDSAKIRRLQRGLNDLDCGERLLEDGVYGPKTQNGWFRFMQELNVGTVPTLCWTNVLQSEKTGIEIGATTAGKKAGLRNALVYDKNPYIRIDPPHPGRTGKYRGTIKDIDYNHINFGNVQNSNRAYEWIRQKYNHYPLDDRAYNVLKDLKTTAKKVRVAGKVLLVAGTALEVLELGLAINSDLKDADKKLGETTLSTTVSIGGRWAGSILFAKGGTLIGAAAGPLAPVAIPVLSIIGGIVGAFAGGRLAEYIVDITYVED